MPSLNTMVTPTASTTTKAMVIMIKMNVSFVFSIIIFINNTIIIICIVFICSYIHS